MSKDGEDSTSLLSKQQEEANKRKSTQLTIRKISIFLMTLFLCSMEEYYGPYHNNNYNNKGVTTFQLLGMLLSVLGHLLLLWLCLEMMFYTLFQKLGILSAKPRSTSSSSSSSTGSSSSPNQMQSFFQIIEVLEFVVRDLYYLMISFGVYVAVKLVLVMK